MNKRVSRELSNAPSIPTQPVECCLGNTRAGSTVVATGYDFEYRTCSNQFEMRKANDCEVIFVNPQPRSEALSIIYPPTYGPFKFSKIAGLARVGRDFVQGRKAKTILKLAGPKGKILDVGTGSGALIRQIARLKGDRESLYANDFSDGILAPLRDEGFKTIAAQAHELAMEERFRVIVLNQVIEHLQNPSRVIQQLTKLLESGGYFLIETPSIEGSDAKLFKRRYWGGYHIPRHFWLFNETSLQSLLKEAGLRIESVSYLCSPAFWIQSLHHVLFDHGWFWSAKLFSETNPVLLALVTALDLSILAGGGKTSNMRVIARKAV